MRPGKRNGAALPSRVRAPAILVGETYVDVASNALVRVVDRRFPARSPGEFIVETADGSRPGERWLRGEGELRDSRCSPPPVALGDGRNSERRPAGNGRRRKA